VFVCNFSYKTDRFTKRCSVILNYIQSPAFVTHEFLKLQGEFQKYFHPTLLKAPLCETRRTTCFTLQPVSSSLSTTHTSPTQTLEQILELFFRNELPPEQFLINHIKYFKNNFYILEKPEVRLGKENTARWMRQNTSTFLFQWKSPLKIKCRATENVKSATTSRDFHTEGS
jgi:hypothetical protein